MKTLTQERASFALEDCNNRNEKYLTCAKKLPTLITTNGLIPTLAFLKSKSDYKEVYDTMKDWLKKRNYINQNEDALKELINSDFSTLRLATIEALSFANWLKRMAEIRENEKEKGRTNE